MAVDKNIPQHVAIIMDGNGRWARSHRLPRIMGHREGVKAVERIVRAAKDLGIKILTLYAFSTENWRRSRREVDALMLLLNEYLMRKARELKKDGVRLTAIGEIQGLPASVRKRLADVIALTKDNTVLTLNLALNYGGRREIVHAAKSVCADVQKGRLDIDSLDENIFSRYLYTKGMIDPDLLIRTSGEMRLSNFLLWQVSYSEIYVTEKFWPDLKKEDLEDAVFSFQKRVRRFGARD